MSIHSDLKRNGSQAKPSLLIIWMGRQLSRLPMLFRAIMGAYLCLVVSTFAIISSAKLQQLNHIVEPPPELMPGNTVPTNLPCDLTTYSQRFQCRFSHEGETGYLVLAGTPARIVSLTISAHKQVLGNLIASWGTPTRVARCGISITVFWKGRWAYLNTRSLNPNNPVEFIGYGQIETSPIPQAILPWRGFANRQNYVCPPGYQ